MKLKNLVLTLAALSGFFISPSLQATCSNYATYVDGQVLTASSLNSLQTNYTNCVNAVLDGDTFTGNMLWHSGSDALLYSDTGSTLKAALYGDTGKIIGGLTKPGQMTNCGISNSGTTFTIAGDDGTALSATNPCVIAIRSNTAGRTALAFFTANVTLTHGSASDSDGNLFGITDANWANTMPLFIGVVYDGTTPYFTISRLPLYQSASASTGVCQKADTDCDGSQDVMILTTGLTLANWINLPITQVGWTLATYATSGGAWTLSTSSATGFNKLGFVTTFTFPVAQMGAAAGTFFTANAGTAPLFTTNLYGYQINEQGIVTAQVYCNADPGTDGAGAVQAQLTLPYAINFYNSGLIATPQIGIALGATTITGGAEALCGMGDGNTTCNLDYPNAATTTANITNAMFSNGARNVKFFFSYPAMGRIL